MSFKISTSLFSSFVVQCETARPINPVYIRKVEITHKYNRMIIVEINQIQGVYKMSHKPCVIRWGIAGHDKNFSLKF